MKVSSPNQYFFVVLHFYLHLQKIKNIFLNSQNSTVTPNNILKTVHIKISPIVPQMPVMADLSDPGSNPGPYIASSCYIPQVPFNLENAFLIRE